MSQLTSGFSDNPRAVFFHLSGGKQLKSGGSVSNKWNITDCMLIGLLLVFCALRCHRFACQKVFLFQLFEHYFLTHLHCIFVPAGFIISIVVYVILLCKTSLIF